MQNLSVREFKDVCDELSPNQFIFYSENQSWNKVEHTIKVKLTFRIILIAFSPDAICLKNDDADYLCLYRVKSVRMDGNSLLGVVFTVICGDSGSNINDIEYTIIAR